MREVKVISATTTGHLETQLQTLAEERPESDFRVDSHTTVVNPHNKDILHTVIVSWEKQGWQ